MSELFLTFILLGVIILVQFLILDSHLDQIEKKIDELKGAGNNSTKDDLVAMLTELRIDISELKSYESADGQDLVMLADIGTLFRQKIDKLKEEKDGIHEA